ncbi:antibiotic biosynthesis monooxygenase [Mesorhizobium sp. B3-1-6]|uniref:putative quinol monooxygenase n=1 Tax=unclassified Mesorhizobium TaxID=325217 RepID=UPI00112DFF92|nr:MULTISPECIES: putative quinol monooxygenase [unclassified Mesorhizobium]TPI30821.1 antibiotic biosynthesis monooxygenase [Mesorhizobium sp. B3-1-6]TPI60107.1 antibiotic biosynthesis monooxygenase [Mesorhizobium sp. B3-1-8]TPI68655.1 antibiotic biosynthesis monooxygenase [Mesorhizobium sp. B3-1-3]
MTVPYTVIGTVIAKPETREELQEILSAFVEPTRAEDGCISYDFHVDPADPCVFMFYENWRSKDDLDRHLAMPHLKPLFDRLDQLLASPVEIRNFVMLSRMAVDVQPISVPTAYQ